MNGYEFLSTLTVNLSAQCAGNTESECTATGFYVRMNNTTVIVTAKHFTDNIDTSVTLPVHYKENNTVVTIPVTAMVKWALSDEHDLAYFDITPISQKFKSITGKEMYFTAISEKNIITKPELYKLPILSEVIALTYPSGISSSHHEHPLFKKGYLSSSPQNIIADGEGFIDMASAGGCSGAPILLNNAELKLIGILVKGSDDDSRTTTYVSADKLLKMI